MFVSAILLAAGESTRMGRQKAQLSWQGTTLLQYQLRQLAAVEEIREIIVVTGHDPDRITDFAFGSPRTRIVQNHDYRTGKVSSILAGLRSAAVEADALLLLAVDQPRSTTITRAVVDAFIASQPKIAVPTNSGRPGHPLLFDCAMLPQLLAITEETQGVRGLMRRNATSILTVDVLDPAVNLDLNTPADVATAWFDS